MRAGGCLLGPAGTGRDAYGHSLDSGDEIRGAAGQGVVARQFEVGEPSAQFLEHDAQFQAGEARSQTVVGPVTAEGDVGIGGTLNVDGIGRREHPFVSVARRVEEQEPVPPAHLLSSQIHVACRCAVHVLDGGDPAQQFFDGGGNPPRVVD